MAGVEEGTAYYAAKLLIQKLLLGQTDGLDALIAEKANKTLMDLRDGTNPAALAEAQKFLSGVNRPRSNKLMGRDTVFYFPNTNKEIVAIYVRKIQGKWVATQLRILKN